MVFADRETGAQTDPDPLLGIHLALPDRLDAEVNNVVPISGPEATLAEQIRLAIDRYGEGMTHFQICGALFCVATEILADTE